MKEYRFLAKLYGVRGSYPIAPPEGTRYGGNTTCLLTRTNNQIVIFDAGSGIVRAGQDLLPEIFKHKESSNDPFFITIMFTHTHIDHLLGFPYFAPLYIPGVHLTLIGPATMGVDFEDIMRTLVEPQYYPVNMDEFRSEQEFFNISENMVVYFNGDDPIPNFTLNGDLEKEAQLVIRNMKYYFHPKDGSYNYRIEWNGNSLVFATDIEQYVGSDQRLAAFAKNADVFIHDSQYSLEQYPKFQGYGHSSVGMACEAAKQSEVKKLLLFHHDPGNDDAALEKLEKEGKKIFPAAELASETWEWVVK